MIQRATRSAGSTGTAKPDKEKVTLVFKTVSQINGKKREGFVTVAEIQQSLGKKINDRDL